MSAGSAAGDGVSGGNGAAAGADRVQAPLGRRAAVVVGNRQSGGYRIFSALDTAGLLPRAGQFYMLASEAGWGGGEAERPYLPRAFSVAAARPSGNGTGTDRGGAAGGGARDGEAAGSGVTLEFLVEAVGPGTARLAALEDGEQLLLTGPLGRPFSPPAELNPDAAGAVLVGGGIGIAPLAVWRRELVAAGIPTRALLGFRDRAHSGGLELFDISKGRSPSATSCEPEAAPGEDEARRDDVGPEAEPAMCPEVRLASEDGHAGHRGYVTDLLAVLLEGEDAARTAAVYACGPPAMLEAVRAMCARRGAACELAMESPMACGFGACFGCAVPLAAGGYMRLCVDGPVVRGDQIETALYEGAPPPHRPTQPAPPPHRPTQPTGHR